MTITWVITWSEKVIIPADRRRKFIGSVVGAVVGAVGVFGGVAAAIVYIQKKKSGWLLCFLDMFWVNIKLSLTTKPSEWSMEAFINIGTATLCWGGFDKLKFEKYIFFCLFKQPHNPPTVTNLSFWKRNDNQLPIYMFYMLFEINIDGWPLSIFYGL